jgi:hypothetical protein
MLLCFLVKKKKKPSAPKKRQNEPLADASAHYTNMPPTHTTRLMKRPSKYKDFLMGIEPKKSRATSCDFEPAVQPLSDVMAVEPFHPPCDLVAAEPATEPPSDFVAAEPFQLLCDLVAAEAVQSPSDFVAGEPVHLPCDLVTSEPVQSPCNSVPAEPVDLPCDLVAAKPATEPPSDFVAAEPFQLLCYLVSAEAVQSPCDLVTAEPVQSPCNSVPAEPVDLPCDLLAAEPATEPPSGFVAGEPVHLPCDLVSAEAVQSPCNIVTAEPVQSPCNSVPAEPVDLPCDLVVAEPAAQPPSDFVRAEPVQLPTDFETMQLQPDEAIIFVKHVSGSEPVMMESEDTIDYPSLVCDNGEPVMIGCEEQTACSVQELINKKRKRSDPSLWRKSLAKSKRNNGQEYSSRSGKTIPAVQFKDFDCQCPLKCSEKLSDDEKQNMFTLYWQSSREAKLAFLCGHVKQNPVKSRYGAKPDESRRQKTRLFYLTKNDQTSVRVCKKMFCNLLKVSNGSLDRSLTRETEGTFMERRGKKEPGNKLPQQDVDKVKSHINSFPRYMSHYCRKDNPDVRFLPQSLNLALMHRMYKSDCINDDSKAVSEAMYRNIFHGSFNLKFQRPKKDTCTKCDSFETQLCALRQLQGEQVEEKIATLTAERDLHHKYVENARSELQADRLAAKDPNHKSKVITFDLQSTLPTPRLSTNVIFYKRQLMVYNLGIHDLADETGFMHVWHEAEASRGAQEIASCIRKHVNNNPGRPSDTELIAWSDSCGGQNRNIKMSLSFLKLVGDTNLPFKTITQKFLESGHSFLPNDADFSDIEKRLKYHPHVFVPQQWYDIVAEARSGAKPFTVVNMERTDMTSTLPLEQATTNRKKDSLNEKVNWLQMKQIQVRREHAKSLFVRYSHAKNEPWKEIDLKKRAKSTSLVDIEQPLLYSAPRKINPLKKKDLLSILHLVPPIYHRFYTDLQVTTKAVEEDIDGLGETVDFEIE